MPHRLKILLFACITACLGCPDRAEAQFVQNIFDQSGTQNRLRSEGEATSAGDPGDPRHESARTDQRFGRKFYHDNDPFGKMRLDPRVGPAFDPLKASEGRIFKGTERTAILSTFPEIQPSGPARVPRGAQAAKHAQFVNRLDPSLRKTMRTSHADRAEVVSRVRRSLDSLTAGGVSASLENGMIILRGVVESEYRRRMIERFVLLEPGVHQVQNEILAEQFP